MIEIQSVDVGFAHQLSLLLLSRTFEEAYRDQHIKENIRAYCDDNNSLDSAKAMLSNPITTCKVAFRNKTPRSQIWGIG